MNILIFNWQDWMNPYSGGAEIHLKEIFSRLAKRGHRVTLFCSYFPGAKKEEFREGIQIIRRGSRNFFNYIVPYYYKKYFSKQGYDIVIDDLNKIPFYTPLYVREPLLAIAHHFFGKSIFLETNFIFGSYVLLAEKLVDFVYKDVPFAVVSNSTLEEYIQRGFKRENFTVIPNCIDHEAFPFQVTEKTPYPSVAYFGRLKKYKSIDHLLMAMRLLLQDFPEVRLFIIGKGDYQKELYKLAQKLGISSNVTFTGYVSDAEKITLLSQMWVVVNPSMKEGWGITNIEANACGTPIISADVPGLRDSVQHMETGLLYPYGNIHVLYNQLRLVISDSHIREKLSKNAVRWAQNFNWDNSADRMESLIEHIVEKSTFNKTLQHHYDF